MFKTIDRNASIVISHMGKMAWIFFAVFFLLMSRAHAADEYLEPDAAFKFSAKLINAKTLAVTYAIADGYYMYRERFKFSAKGAQLGEPVFPPGKIKFDDTFQKNVETYRHSITITLPVQANAPFVLRASSQGCADQGLCYAPMDSEATLNPKDAPTDSGATILPAVGGSASNATIRAASAPSTVTVNTDKASVSSLPANSTHVESEIGTIQAALKSGRLLAILPLFLLLGLGLSFTPCVLPMVPILSFIIVGEGQQVKRKRGFVLSVIYSLGMALVYTALGMAAGLAGEGLAASLQNPWMLGAFALLMVGLSLSMFDVYQLQMPASIQEKLMKASEKQPAGKLFGVFVMGALSALIVGPCVAAPLAGALVYISQTHDLVVGGAALFAMAIGMSVPLLLVGLSAGALLPRAGAWMEDVKRFFGVLMLAMALWIIAPVIPVALQMSGWAVLGIGYGTWLLLAKNRRHFLRAAGLIFSVLGLMQLVGVMTGGRDPFAPLAHLTQVPVQKIPFLRVKSVTELEKALTQANGKIVLLDFYADWCVACKEMEKFTFSDPRIQAQFANMVLLQVDVTANDGDDKVLLKKFNLFGPPGIIFFNKKGQEIQSGRVIGYQNPEKFLGSLSLVSSF
jgi:thioredoxin:protein disulfide reductase